eukprot:3733489-Rhodomonas_salina.1
MTCKSHHAEQSRIHATISFPPSSSGCVATASFLTAGLLRAYCRGWVAPGTRVPGCFKFYRLESTVTQWQCQYSVVKCDAERTKSLLRGSLREGAAVTSSMSTSSTTTTSSSTSTTTSLCFAQNADGPRLGPWDCDVRDLVQMYSRTFLEAYRGFP